MATITTAQFGSSTCPQAQLVVTESGSTATDGKLNWVLKWVTHGYKVSSSASKAYTVKINDTVVKSGTFAIGGKTNCDIASGTVTIPKGTAAKTIPLYISFDMTFTWSSANPTYGGTKTASGNITIGAKTSYTISYNANGGSGAPGSQTKWHGTNITLSTSKPTRTGYTFQGWATSATGAVAYQPGGSYTGNAGVTLYAIWKIVTYQISYNANGGTGAPGAQTKNYGTNITLSATKPTKANYNFKGWATSATGAVSYAAGATYTANTAITLYAVWELAYENPTITNLKASRCNSDGTLNETGTYAKVTFSWSCCQLVGANAVKSIVISWTGGSVTVTASGNSGNVSQVVGAGAFNSDVNYPISVAITDSKNGLTTVPVNLPATKYPIDFKAGGDGVTFGGPATKAGFNCLMPAEFTNNTKINSIPFDRFYVHRKNLTTENLNDVTQTGCYIQHTNANALATRNYPLNQIAGMLQVVNGNGGQIYQTYHTYTNNEYYYRCFYTDTWRPWKRLDYYGTQKVLWSGGYYMTAGHTATLSEKVSAQRNGIVLAFSQYTNGVANDFGFWTVFVPKDHVAKWPGKDVQCFMLPTTFTKISCKSIFVFDDKLVGNDDNAKNGTLNGITFNNSYYILRYVYGV